MTVRIFTGLGSHAKNSFKVALGRILERNFSQFSGQYHYYGALCKLKIKQNVGIVQHIVYWEQKDVRDVITLDIAIASVRLHIGKNTKRLVNRLFWRNQTDILYQK